MYTTHRFRGFGSAGSFGPEGPSALRAGIAIDTRTVTRQGASAAMRQIQQQTSNPIAQLSTSAQEAVRASGMLTRPGPSGDALAGTQCECYVEAVRKHAESQGMALDAATLAQLSLQCASDEASFVTAMKDGGVGYEACKPVYTRKTTWILGGVVVLGALLVLR